MSKPKSLIMAALLVIISVAGWYLLSGPDTSQPKTGKMEDRPTTGVVIGSSLPELKLSALDGSTVSIGAPGKITVINFWATWCPPCRAEMPELDEFARKYGTQVNFAAINIQEPGDKVADFLKQQKISMRVLLDKDGEVARMFRINAIPTTVVTDKDGVIRLRKSGTVTLSELEGIIKGL